MRAHTTPLPRLRDDDVELRADPSFLDGSMHGDESSITQSSAPRDFPIGSVLPRLRRNLNREAGRREDLGALSEISGLLPVFL
jgi:hypothetical protein